jgi:hypothetical protein
MEKMRENYMEEESRDIHPVLRPDGVETVRSEHFLHLVAQPIAGSEPAN